MPTSFRSSPSDIIAGGSDVLPTSHPLRRSVWIAAVLAIILMTTRAVELGDTQGYANDIVDHLGKSPFGAGNSLWEFGHLLWRPLGWVMLTLLSPLLSALTNWTPTMQASFVLIAMSAVCALIAVVFWYAIARRATGSSGVAFMVVIATACSHGFLLYAHSGCAYITGLAFLTIGVYFLLARRIVAGAVFYGLSALIWFPFILAGAGLLLLAAGPSENWNASLGERFAKPDRAGAIRFIVLSATVVLFVYGFALYARRVSSFDEAGAWVNAARHGYSESNRVARIATGLPRSFLYLGKDGILYKRYLRRDPYAPVSPGRIAGASLWKLAAFDLFVVCLLYELLRKPRSGWMLLLFGAGVGPVIFFAVAIFEPGSPERYLPALPFFVLATAWVLRDVAVRRRVTQLVIAAFLLCVVLANVYSFAAPRVSAENAASLSRIADLRRRLSGSGVAMLTTNQDDLEQTLNRLAFDDINRPTPIAVYDIIEPGNTQVLTWRRNLADRTLKAWRRGGEVWVSKRVWSARPLPPWNWVEGDDPRISWKELPPFFASLNVDAESGGPDGFLRLARNQTNIALLESLAAGK
jgi:hypothetical protein